jgi:hypothetical protein
MSKLLRDQAGNVYPDIVGKLGTAQVIVAAATSAQSAAVGTETTLVRIATTNLTGASSHVHVKINTNPTATASDTIIPCGMVEYFAITPGEKVAVLRGGGTNIDVSITEITNA